MKSIEDFVMYLKLTLEVRSDFQQAVEKGISKMILAPSDLIYARWLIPESLSTERRQLSKVETDLEDKIINLFNGTSSSALCDFSCCVSFCGSSLATLHLSLMSCHWFSKLGS